VDKLPTQLRWREFARAIRNLKYRELPSKGGAAHRRSYRRLTPIRDTQRRKPGNTQKVLPTNQCRFNNLPHTHSYSFRDANSTIRRSAHRLRSGRAPRDAVEAPRLQAGEVNANTAPYTSSTNRSKQVGHLYNVLPTNQSRFNSLPHIAEFF
jgi:hypothetical protein